MTCTFFGHCDFPEDKTPLIEKVVKILIEDYGVTNFYVGDRGHFDFCVRKTLKKLQQNYPQINYAVVLSKLNIPRDEFIKEDYSDTIFPDELTKCPPRFAISNRNRWMLKQSQIVVCYVNQIHNADKFMHMAENQKKPVVNIGSFHPEKISIEEFVHQSMQK